MAGMSLLLVFIITLVSNHGELNLFLYRSAGIVPFAISRGLFLQKLFKLFDHRLLLLRTNVGVLVVVFFQFRLWLTLPSYSVDDGMHTNTLPVSSRPEPAS